MVYQQKNKYKPKKKYKLLEEKGERRKVILALFRSPENNCSITRLLGHKTKSSGSVEKDFKKLKDNNLLIDSRRDGLDLNGNYYTRPAYLLDIGEYFLQKTYEYSNFSYSKKEIDWLKIFLSKRIEDISRETACTKCLYYYYGLLFPYLIKIILDFFLEESNKNIVEEFKELYFKIVNLVFLYFDTRIFNMEYQESLLNLKDKLVNDDENLENLFDSLELTPLIIDIKKCLYPANPDKKVHDFFITFNQHKPSHQFTFEYEEGYPEDKGEFLLDHPKIKIFYVPSGTKRRKMKNGGKKQVTFEEMKKIIGTSKD